MYLNSCGIVAVAAKENGQIAVSRRKEKNDEDYYRNNGNETGTGVHTLSSVLQSIEQFGRSATLLRCSDTVLYRICTKESAVQTG